MSDTVRLIELTVYLKIPEGKEIKIDGPHDELKPILVALGGNDRSNSRNSVFIRYESDLLDFVEFPRENVAYWEVKELEE